jgi:hypothetical protein
LRYDEASVVLLTCSDEPDSAAAATTPPDVRRVTVPARPARADVDPLLAAGDLRRLVVAGTDADLAAVLVRVLRTNRLDVELAYVPADRHSVAARICGLPRGAAAFELARTGVARAVPLVRDDAGGVLVGRAELRGIGGRALHGEVYCDGELVLRGGARRLVVTPWVDARAIEVPTAPGPADPAPVPTGGPAAAVREPAPAAVAVRAGRTGALPDGRLRSVPPTARAGRGAALGRAVQVGCLPATVVRDGVVHPRPVTRWAWYRHVADWLLVRGAAR